MLNAGNFALSGGGTSKEEIASLVESEMVPKSRFLTFDEGEPLYFGHFSSV